MQTQNVTKPNKSESLNMRITEMAACCVSERGITSYKVSKTVSTLLLIGNYFVPDLLFTDVTAYMYVC